MNNLDLKNKRIFISGGSGVIGRYLVSKLHKLGAKIFVGDLQLRPGDWPKDIIYRQGDLNTLTSEEVVSFAPEYFFHLAATFERSAESYEFWQENFHHNLALSNHLMTLMKDLPSLEKVIFASSYLIYEPNLYHFKDCSTAPTPLIEDAPIYPRNLIGSAKLHHEIELRFLDQYKDTQFKSVSARIYRSYGFGSRDVISRWIRAAIKGDTLEIYQPENRFDYVYAGDVAEGLIKLASSSNGIGIVNLGRGRARSIEELIAILQSHYPKLKLKYMDSTNQIYEASQADTTKLKSITSWNPTKDLEDSIPEIIKYEENALKNKNREASNILVTSISEKIPLLREVKLALSKATSGQGLIYGGDSNKECTGKYFVDAFWTMPKTTKLTAATIIKYCKEHAITMIIPTRDGELQFFADIRRELLESGIHTMVSNPKTINLCIDKYSFAKHGLKCFLPVIPSYLDSNQISTTKLVVKERFGAGSRKLGLAITPKEADFLASTMESPVFQTYIEGDEISIDAYVNSSGQVKGVNMRIRNLVENGESKITTLYNNHELEKIARKFFQSLDFYGHVMLQVIVDKSGSYHILECNPRFGGASTLAISAGLESFYWFILEAMGITLDNYQFIYSPITLRQIRYKSDLIVAV